MKTSLKSTLLLLALISLTHCSFRKTESVKSTSEDSLQNKGEDFPLALLNADQALSTMLRLTGQSAPNNAVLNEYNIRNSSFSVRSELTMMNAPLLLSATSLAGEVCNSLIAKERGLASESRLFFQGINFSTGVDKINNTIFMTTIDRFAEKLWGRPLTDSESALFADFFATFVMDLTDAQRTQAAQTQALALSACSATLSSFETLTF